MRLSRDLLLALVAGLVILILGVATSPKHLMSVALLALAVTVLLLVVLLIIDSKRSPGLDHGLVVKDHQVHAEDRSEDPGFLHVSVGAMVLNNAEMPLGYRAERFTVQLGHVVTSPLSGSPDLTVAVGREQGWFRDPIRLAQLDGPMQVTVDFRFLYGKAGKKYERFVEGCVTARVPTMAPELENLGDVREFGALVKEVRPTVDGTIPSRWRK